MGSQEQTQEQVTGPCTCTLTTLCDACALQQIQALNASEDAGFVELQPGVLAPSERSDLRSAIAGWLSNLGGR